MCPPWPSLALPGLPQDSTCLWESLPAEVMDAALKTHHTALRRTMLLHDAYESATEG